MKTFVLCSILLAACTTPALAQAETACEMAAFVANTDSGVRIRAEADLKAPIVGRLPANAGGTLVFIQGARNGWLKVTSAIDASKTRVFTGTGWIHAPLLAVRTFSRDDSLVDYHASPDRQSDALGSLRAELDVELRTLMRPLFQKHQDDIITGVFSSTMMQDWDAGDVNLLGCSGDWVKVAVPMRGGADTEGWLPHGAWCGSPWEDCM